MTPEGKVKKAIEYLLENEGEDVYVFKPVQTGYGTRTLDYLCCVRGRFLGIEAKRQKGRMVLTLNQRKAMLSILRAGGKVMKISNEDGLMALHRWLQFTREHGAYA